MGTHSPPVRRNLLLCAVFALTTLAVAHGRLDSPDLSRPEKGGEDMIRDFGYPVERHFPVTSDGFILGMFRIPHGRDEVAPPKGAQARPVVLLQHGLLDSSDTWILNGPGESFAFVLADAGFDVWLGNNRGNLYSRNHTSLNPNWPHRRFWDWSFTEMGRIDVPTMIQHIKATTGVQKVSMVGHSQGCTQMMVNFVRDETLVNDISLFVALAPAVYVYHTTSVLLTAAAAFGIDKLVLLLGINEFLPHSDLLEILLPSLCRTTPKLCSNALYLIAGFSEENYDLDMLPIYMEHYPAGVSTKDMSHWAQSIRWNAEFKDYDYGILLNPINYGRLTPPEFDLTKANAPPIAVFWGGNDTLATPTDVAKQISNLGNHVIYEKLLPHYDHLAFSWGARAREDIYEPAIELIREQLKKDELAELATLRID